MTALMVLGRFPWTRQWAARGGPAADPPWGTWATPDILFFCLRTTQIALGVNKKKEFAAVPKPP